MSYPSNPAHTDLPLLDVLRERWSPLAFDSKQIEPEKIALLWEAARWAPSSYNEQPWRYLYCLKDDGEERAKLESLLLDGNSWAKEAPLLILSFAKKTFTRNGEENVHTLHDLGCATGFLVLQATALDLITHQMAGFKRDEANRLFSIPDDFIPGSMIAVGYHAAAAIPPALKEREESPRTRNPREKFAFGGTWKE